MCWENGCCILQNSKRSCKHKCIKFSDCRKPAAPIIGCCRALILSIYCCYSILVKEKIIIRYWKLLGKQPFHQNIIECHRESFIYIIIYSFKLSIIKKSFRWNVKIRKFIVINIDFVMKKKYNIPYFLFVSGLVLYLLWKWIFFNGLVLTF